MPSPSPVLSAVSARRSADVALWANFRDGDKDALAQLYKEHISSLRRHGMCVCKDPELVSDCIHELFSRLWTRRDRISDAQNVKLYLYKSLERIVVAQKLRNKKRSAELQNVDAIPSDSSEQLLIDGELRKQRVEEIKKCVQSLPKCQREVILLKFFNDLSYVEISEIMDVQVDSVYNLASKAIEQLRQMLHSQPVVAS